VLGNHETEFKSLSCGGTRMFGNVRKAYELVSTLRPSSSEINIYITEVTNGSVLQLSILQLS